MSRTRLVPFLVLLAVGSSATAQVPMTVPVHPLDHLTPAEHWVGS